MTLGAIDVRELLDRPGVSREQPVRGTVDGLTTELAQIPDDAPVAADLLLESVVEGIVVSGHVGGTWRLRCARCLTEFDRPFDVTVSELFVPSPEEDVDAYPLGPDGELDPDQMVVTSAQQNEGIAELKEAIWGLISGGPQRDPGLAPGVSLPPDP